MFSQTVDILEAVKCFQRTFYIHEHQQKWFGSLWITELNSWEEFKKIPLKMGKK